MLVATFDWWGSRLWTDTYVPITYHNQAFSLPNDAATKVITPGRLDFDVTKQEKFLVTEVTPVTPTLPIFFFLLDSGRRSVSVAPLS